MNTILQKRIDEAAYEESSTYGLTEIKESNAAYNAAIKVATFILQNQWISVDEALPEEDGIYYVITDGTRNEVYDMAKYENKVWHKASKITYWMPIPELKGCKK